MKKLFALGCALATLTACAEQSSPVASEPSGPVWSATAPADSLMDNGGMAGGSLAECGENGGMAGGSRECGEP